MWTIIRFEKKKLELLKEDLRKKLGKDFIIYIPKIKIQNYRKNKLINLEFNLLGDYMFCFHKKFSDSRYLNIVKFSRGLKYLLKGYVESQKDISTFIKKCKYSECTEGFLSKNFSNLCIDKNYIFSTGPFTKKIFQIINLQKNTINILLGNVKTSIKKHDFLFAPA
tara:strand:- start:261 stop:758 length:498 start_codon:yes stop_codon:yes gene_type:complete